MTPLFRTFWEYLENPTHIYALYSMNQKAAMNPKQHTERAEAEKSSADNRSSEKQQARKNSYTAQKSPEKRQSSAEQKKSADALQGENNERKNLYHRQAVQAREDEVTDFRRDFTDEELLAITQGTIPAPNHFHNAQECANKNLALFWLNLGHCFFHGVAGRS